ncbi:hypothetical protein [Streptomyces xylophagus]|uniref:hypothetical protein n=1 Tax=Streptomyces xylophagus TaxID=285514 RepID=UPI0005BAAE0B|nr:hypothetical protein [Streptomyces xylophagus]
MANLSFTPTFQDVPWEDRKSRVTAAGPGGFNGKFNAIASDLRQLSTVVADIGAAIDASNTPPPPQQQRLSFTPVLRAVGLSDPWSYDADGVATATISEPPDSVVGVTNLSLPDGFRLTSLRVVGSINDSGLATSSNVSLARTPLRLVVPPATPETLAFTLVNGDGGFDFQIPVTASRALIDTTVFRYVFTAAFSTSEAGTMSIEAVHLTLAPPS